MRASSRSSRWGSMPRRESRCSPNTIATGRWRSGRCSCFSSQARSRWCSGSHSSGLSFPRPWFSSAPSGVYAGLNLFSGGIQTLLALLYSRRFLAAPARVGTAPFRTRGRSCAQPYGRHGWVQEGSADAPAGRPYHPGRTDRFCPPHNNGHHGRRRRRVRSVPPGRRPGTMIRAFMAPQGAQDLS